MFKHITIKQGYDYYIDLSIVKDSAYQEVYDYVMEGHITDGAVINGEVNKIATFTIEQKDDYTFRCSLTNEQTNELQTGKYKYVIDYTDIDSIKDVAVYGDITVESVYG